MSERQPSESDQDRIMIPLHIVGFLLLQAATYEPCAFVSASLLPGLGDVSNKSVVLNNETHLGSGEGDENAQQICFYVGYKVPRFRLRDTDCTYRRMTA